MSTFHEEQRRQERVPFKRDIMLNDDVTVKAIDISQGGMYIHTFDPFRVGDIVDVSLPLRGETFKIKARIKHVQKGVGMGLMFIDMDVGQMEKLEQVIVVARKRPRRETKKIKVLFVEDDDTSRKMLKNHMLSEGLWVIEAANGIEAIKTLNEQPVDIVVLDLHMEQMSGFKVLSIIKESPEWVDIDRKSVV